MSDAATKPAGSPAEIFARVLDGSAGWLSPDYATVLAVPDDELHREILLPLLPAMLGDKAIRQGWREGPAGFFTRVRAHIEGDAPAPRWLPQDFEIPVASSYLAGPDAKALADTLLSEPSLRDLTAELMNRVLDTVWPRLPLAGIAAPEPVAEEEPIVPAAIEPAIEPAETEAAVSEEEFAVEVTQPAEAGVSRFITPIRITSVRRSPIRGTRHSFGGLAARGPLARNPLRHAWPRMPLR